MVRIRSPQEVAATGDYGQFNRGNGRDYCCAGEGVRRHLEEYVPEDGDGELPARAGALSASVSRDSRAAPG